MRKLTLSAVALAAFAFAFAFAPLCAQAQTYSKGQTGAVGPVITATDPSGVSQLVVLPSVTLTTSGGAAPTGANAMQVQGAAASGATNLGNPVKTGCTFRSTEYTLTDLQVGDCGVDSRGNLRVVIQAGAQSAATSIPNSDAKSYTGNGGLNTNAVGFVWNGATFDRTTGDVNGAVVQNWALAAARWNYAAAASGIVNTTTAVTIKAAAGASVRNYIDSCQIDHDLLGAATELVIRDGAAGTVLIRMKLQTAAAESRTYNFDSPLKGTANTLLEVTTLTAVTGGVYVNCQGHTGT